MLEPSVYRFENGKLVTPEQGCAKIEYQTPEEYIRSTPLQFIEEVDWGDSRIRFLKMEDPDGAIFYYALVERFIDGKPDPRWAIIQIPEKDLGAFRDEFRVYCDKK